MSENGVLFFKYGDSMYSIWMDEIKFSLMESLMFKKLRLDESKVKLKISYIPLLVGEDEQLIIRDDGDVVAYLKYCGKQERISKLFVEVIDRTEQSEQQSRVVKSSNGKNYDECNDDEIGVDAITVYVEKEPINLVDDIVDEERIVDDISDTSGIGDDYVESPPIGESCSQFIEEWEDGLGISVLQEFPNKKTLQEVVDKASFMNCFSFAVKKSCPERLVLKCTKGNCNWSLRATRIRDTEIFSVRKYTKMHTCSRASQSENNFKRKGTPQLVAALLQEDYPGQLNTPAPKVIVDLVKTKLGVSISYATARRGKNLAISNLRGTPEESYKLLFCYLHMLEKANKGTVTHVHLDEKDKFKYLFIALGACIRGFIVMRKVIIVDATFLKNGYGGVLVFATAQDPNRHHYPLAVAVLDGENNDSWTWFFKMLKTVIPDSSELVFMSDRNASLIGAIGYVYPQARHGYCIWHMSQNVKSHASNVNKDVVAWRFMECSRMYTVADFNYAFSLFKTRYPSAGRYVEETTVKEKWARCVFPGDRYNIDTSNSVESLNGVFRNARKYSLIPMLDTIIKTFSRWFNEHRKDVVLGTSENKLVPFVENNMHALWATAEKLIVNELNSFNREYNVIGGDGRNYTVNLMLKICTCRVFDIEKYPCVHALAAYIKYLRNPDGEHAIEFHELCSKYYWTELWTIAYFETIHLVADMSQWVVPEEIMRKVVFPPDRKVRKGRIRLKRLPSVGEKGIRTKNLRRRRQGTGLCYWLGGNRDKDSEDN